MFNLLQLSLESDDPTVITGDTIKLQGPLADTYTEALNIALSKEQPLQATDTISQESFSSQQGHLASLAPMLSEEIEDESDTSRIMVYAVNASGATHEDVKQISTMLANGEEEPNTQVVIITDTSLQSVKEGVPDAGSTNVLLPAIESLVEAYGAKHFTNLPTFINSVKKR